MSNRIVIKIVGIIFVILLSLTKSEGQNLEVPIRQPKEIIINGKIDSFGFFRFYTQDFLLDYSTRLINEKIDGDFYFTKEMYDSEKKLKYRVVYPYYEYSYSIKSFRDSLSYDQIKSILSKIDSFSKSDNWKIKNIVDSKTFNTINALTEHQFFAKYLSKFGVLINYKNEQEQLAIALRLLQMNISVGVADISGDLVIPTTSIGYPVY